MGVREGIFLSRFYAYIYYSQVQGGHGPEPKRVWYARDHEIPEAEDILPKIFPKLEESRELVRLAGLIEIAGTSFLDLMEHLRKVIMQDVACLQDTEEFKDHPLFNHEVSTSF
jgi:hypothetical protein